MIARVVMTDAMATVTPKATLRKALTTMLHNKFGCLQVVDSDHMLVGLIPRPTW